MPKDLQEAYAPLPASAVSANAMPANESIKSTLISRNITILGRRTSVRLEAEMWMALREIAKRELCSIHDICSLISMRKHTGTSLTAAVRVFLMLYFRAASTEEGHKKAGHGSFAQMRDRARLPQAYQPMNGRVRAAL